MANGASRVNHTDMTKQNVPYVNYAAFHTMYTMPDAISNSLLVYVKSLHTT